MSRSLKPCKLYDNNDEEDDGDENDDDDDVERKNGLISYHECLPV